MMMSLKFLFLKPCFSFYLKKRRYFRFSPLASIFAFFSQTFLCETSNFFVAFSPTAFFSSCSSLPFCLLATSWFFLQQSSLTWVHCEIELCLVLSFRGSCFVCVANNIYKNVSISFCIVVYIFWKDVCVPPWNSCSYFYMPSYTFYLILICSIPSMWHAFVRYKNGRFLRDPRKRPGYEREW